MQGHQQSPNLSLCPNKNSDFLFLVPISPRISLLSWRSRDEIANGPGEIANCS